MRLKGLFLLGMLLLAPLGYAADRVVVLGDSLSAAYGIAERDGWVALLSQRLQAEQIDAKVINASVTGDTSSGGLARLPALLKQHSPSWVLIELGGNDGLRALSLNKLRENLRAMIELAQQAQARVLLIGVPQPPHYGRAYARRFGAVFDNVASEKQVPLVADILAGLDQNPQWLQDDGIHPSEQAQPLMLDNVWRVLAPLLEKSPA